MTQTTNSASNVDDVMSEVGTRALGALHKAFKGLPSERAGHVVANALADATAVQRYELADVLIDLIGVSQLMQAAMADSALDKDEEEVFRACIKDLADDSLAVIKYILPEPRQ